MSRMPHGHQDTRVQNGSACVFVSSLAYILQHFASMAWFVARCGLHWVQHVCLFYASDITFPEREHAPVFIHNSLDFEPFARLHTHEPRCADAACHSKLQCTGKS